MNEVENTVDDFTLGKDQWVTMIEESRKTFEFMPHAYYDMYGVDFLAPVIEGYMPGPVTIYKGKPVEARSVVFDNIKDTLDTMMNNGERILMYMLIYQPATPIYSTLDETTFTNIPLDEPIMRKSSWKMRFGKI